MIQQLSKLRGIGVQSATVLVREAFVREFANGKSARILTLAFLCDAALQQSGGAERDSRASARPETAGYEIHNDRVGLVMAALSTRFRRSRLVSALASPAPERVCAR